MKSGYVPDQSEHNRKFCIWRYVMFELILSIFTIKGEQIKEVLYLLRRQVNLIYI